MVYNHNTLTTMKMTTIFTILKEFENDFASNKMSSKERETAFLILYINKQSKDIQQDFKDFCLEELKTNEHEMQYWIPQILIKLNDTELISKIHAIFCQFYRSNNPFAKNVFLVLMKLRDAEHTHLQDYYFFVENVLQINETFSFTSVIEYIAINQEHALNVLSNYYVELFSSQAKHFTYLSSYIFVPYLFFTETSFEYMQQLIKQTYKKEKHAGMQLKKLFKDYATLTPNENRIEAKNKQHMLECLNMISFN